MLHADPRFDGFVAKYMGDGVLAYFGTRVPTKTTRSRRCEPA
jgi:class 3 adenylate cyclase